MTASQSSLGSLTHALLRIGAGLLFMQHGAQKLFGVPGDGSPVELLSVYGLAGVLEFVGGAFVVLGLLTRPTSAILTVLMVVAFFMGHAGRGGFPIENGGELALLYAAVFAFLATNGPGAFSLDHRWTPFKSSGVQVFRRS